MIYLVVAWGSGVPLLRTYVDKRVAARVYRESLTDWDHAYLYECDESGRVELILEHERIPES